MHVTLEIDGRTALPLRTIPYVTSWKESPDSIVGVLFERSHVRLDRFNDLYAYQIDSQGHFEQVPPEQWGILVAALKSLSARLKADRGGGADAAVESYGTWQIESVLILPDNVFVWLDEFQRWYSGSRLMLCDPLEDASVIKYEEPTVCLTPLLPPEIEGKLWRYPQKALTTVEQVPEKPAADHEAATAGSPAKGEIAKPRPFMPGKPSNEIIECFKLVPAEAWREKLRHIDKAAKAYKGAIAQRGSRGKCSHTWHPARFAICLLAQKEKDEGQLRVALTKHFPDSLAEFVDLKIEMGS